MVMHKTGAENGWVGGENRVTRLHVYTRRNARYMRTMTYRTARMPSNDVRYGQERSQDADEREEALGNVILRWSLGSIVDFFPR